VDSIRVPDGKVSRFIRDTTSFMEHIEDTIPGGRNFFVRDL
jgi:hypothetical protein